MCSTRGRARNARHPNGFNLHPLRATTDAARAASQAIATIAGERVELHADRALYWPRARTLFVADVHLGKAATFRAGGVPIPRGTTARDLERLTGLLAATRAETLYVLGDLIHAAAGRVGALHESVERWRAAHASIAVRLVRGNHDDHAGDPPSSWRIDVVGRMQALPPFLACHEPCSPPTGYALCGHVHPGVRLAGQVDAARLPCFVLGARRALLPAFGGFTGLGHFDHAPGDRIVAIAGQRLFKLPRRE